MLSKFNSSWTRESKSNLFFAATIFRILFVKCTTSGYYLHLLIFSVLSDGS